MGIGQRIFATVYDRVMARAEKTVYAEYRPYVAGQAKGKVLAIGAGTGANLRYYPQGVSLTVVDPNPHMLRRLRRKARELAVELEAYELRAEGLPFPDRSFDTVVATLVLCSIDDPAQGLGEIRRVLVDGGELRFMEHVRGETSGWTRLQDWVTPVWKRFVQGCHPNRNTLAAIRQAGLEPVETKSFVFGPYPIRPHVAGVARRID